MNFEDFIYQCFYTIAPARKLSKNWHIKVIAHHLDKTHDHKRLIISIPPRFMKSICVSVAWPAWILGHNPSANIIVASYSQGLSVKHSLDTRYIIQSDWYQKIFPNTILSREQNTKHKFQTTKRGFRLATSVGGTITGEGADILIADDPITPMEANSIKYRNRVIDWFEQIFISRLNCLQQGIIVVIMHRLHQEDLVANLLAKKSNIWTSLSLPIITESEQKIYCGKKLLYSRPKNHILDQNRYNSHNIENIKQEIGSYAFAAQYQQRPIPISSGIIKKEYFSRYSALPIGEHKIHQSWDTASSSSVNSDFSVCITYIIVNATIYIIDIIRGHFDYPKLKQILIDAAKKWKAHEILVEEKASGIQLLQELKQQELLPLIGIKPKADKLHRLNLVLPLIEARKISLPYYASWLADFEYEVLSFPNSAHDDQIDSITQLLLRVQGKKQEELHFRAI